MALTAFEGWEGSGLSYPVLYTFKAAIVTAALVMSRRVWRDIQLDKKMILPGILVGILVYVEWIYVDRHTYHFAILGKRTAFDPYHAFDNSSLRALFLLVRFYGLVLMVPLMEELFWRSFLLRWITDPEFDRIKQGQYSLSAFAVVVGAFSFSHPEWLAAAICAAAYALLLRKTGSIFACFLAHATTNLLLGIYVLQTHAWTLW